MIKPRYIKSLTFLLLCNMALWDRKQLLGGPQMAHSQLPLVGLVLVLRELKKFHLRQKLQKTGERVQ